MTAYPYDIGAVTVEDAREMECPKCGRKAGESCVYTTDTFTYLRYPEYGRAPKHHQGDIMLTSVHQERRDAVRRRRMRARRAGLVTRATPGSRGAAAAMRAWDVEEFNRMRGWLAENGWLLIEANLERRPDGSPRGASYAMDPDGTLLRRQAPAPETVTDKWSCDRDGLLGLSPGLDLPAEQHEHAHHDGCYFAHAHEGGQERHDHTYECLEESCKHIMMQGVS